MGIVPSCQPWGEAAEEERSCVRFVKHVRNVRRTYSSKLQQYAPIGRLPSYGRGCGGELLRKVDHYGRTFVLVWMYVLIVVFIVVLIVVLIAETRVTIEYSDAQTMVVTDY